MYLRSVRETKHKRKGYVSPFPSLGGIVAAAMIGNAIHRFVEDIAKDKIEVKVTFERKGKHGK